MAEIKTKSRKNGTDKKSSGKKSAGGASKKKAKRKTSRRRQKSFSWWKLLLVAGLVTAAALALYIAYCFATLPDIEQAVSRTRQPSTTVIAENGQEIRSFGNVYSEVVYPSELPSYVKNAIIATEDRRVYYHLGF